MRPARYYCFETVGRGRGARRRRKRDVSARGYGMGSYRCTDGEALLRTVETRSKLRRYKCCATVVVVAIVAAATAGRSLRTETIKGL